jgi:hypothetical protein
MNTLYKYSSESVIKVSKTQNWGICKPGALLQTPTFLIYLPYKIAAASFNSHRNFTPASF